VKEDHALLVLANKERLKKQKTEANEEELDMERTRATQESGEKYIAIVDKVDAIAKYVQGK
jgi:hypothetical protein